MLGEACSVQSTSAGDPQESEASEQTTAPRERGEDSSDAARVHAAHDDRVASRSERGFGNGSLSAASRQTSSSRPGSSTRRFCMELEERDRQRQAKVEELQVHVERLQAQLAEARQGAAVAAADEETTQQEASPAALPASAV